MPRDAAVAALSWRVEETCLNAWPGLREIILDGWLLRFSEGLSRRANSANPLSHRAAASTIVIAGGAMLYRRHHLPPIFRVPTILPDAVDARLAEAGFAAEGETCVLYRPLARLDATADARVRLRARPDISWFAAMHALQGHAETQAQTYRRIVRRIAIPAAFALLEDEGRPAALAYGVIHNGLLCYESVITDQAKRRRGHGRRVVAALAGWGKAHGAAGACLQVAADNAPALALYDRVGLSRELYRYHYRRTPPGGRL